MFPSFVNPNWALTRSWLQRLLAFMYLNAFLIAFNQAPALIGEHGLLPMRLYLEQARFTDAPGLFFFHSGDAAIYVVAGLGLLLSTLTLLGAFSRCGLALGAFVWALLWLLYLSFVNAGQTFWGFGWEMLLLELGFLAIFLGPAHIAPPSVMPWLCRWLLFRLMFGAGMIKIRGDSCWLDLSCMFYHYETQPLPNPLSWFFHHLPPWLHRCEVLATHFIELMVPFALFLPKPWRWAAAVITALFQMILILSGNLAWLNFLTLVLCVGCLDDDFFYRYFRVLKFPVGRIDPWFHRGLIPIVTVLLIILSFKPAINLFAHDQKMNASFEPLHIVNTYGAFGSVTRVRHELIIEGTSDDIPIANAHWLPYEFKRKPGAVDLMPQQISPYYFKLDWQIWFAAMTPYSDHPWMLNVVSKLLRGDRLTLGLLANNPFPDKPPRFIRVERYEYHFMPKIFGISGSEGAWWRRHRVDSYLPPLSLNDPSFSELLRKLRWN
jgi:hypothetical protein